MPYCSDCGARTGSADRYCANCGALLRRKTGDTSDENQSARSQQSSVLYEDENSGEVSIPSPRERSSSLKEYENPENNTLLGFSLHYPSRGGIGFVLVSGVALVTAALFFWVFLIPVFFIIGYFIRLTAFAAAGKAEPPGFEKPGKLVWDGFTFTLALLPVWLPFTVIWWKADEVSFALGFVVSAVQVYIISAMYLNFAVDRHWTSLYSLSALLNFWSNKTYVIGVLIYTFVISGIGTLVVFMLLLTTLVTIVGWIVLWPMIIFYWFAVGASLWGAVYYKIHGPAEISDPDPDRLSRPR